MLIRREFPQVYALQHPKGGWYWLVSARKWGMKQRKTFNTKKAALDHARHIEQQIIRCGTQPDLPKEKLHAARSYEDLIVKLATFGRTPEEATDHFLRHLSNEAVKQAKPSIRDLAEKWK